MPSSDIKLKHIALANIPEFIRDEYKTFTAFLSAYHDWLELNQANISSLANLDTTLTSFITHFKNEVDPTGIHFPNIDDKILLRHIKNFYLSKGTEESYRTLFRLMYNKDVMLKYPEQMCIKPSDGKWEQIHSIFLETSAGDGQTLLKQKVSVVNPTTNRTLKLDILDVKLRREGGSITQILLSNGGINYGADTVIQIIGGGGKGAKAHVEIVNPTQVITQLTTSGATNNAATNTLGVNSRTQFTVTSTGTISKIVIDDPGSGYVMAPTIIITSPTGTGATLDKVVMYMSPTIWECEIDRQYYGTLSIGDEIQFNEYRGKIMPTINSYSILNAGKNFRLGQTFTIDTVFGAGSMVKVTSLDSNKGVKELKFIKYGYGYLTDFISDNIIPPNTSQAIPIEGFTGLSGTFYEYTQVDPSGGYVLSETYTTADADGLYSVNYVGDIKREFYSYNKYQGDPTNGARINFKLGAVAKYPGHYVNADGMASDEVKIQDSRWYQKYSVVVQVDEKLEKYKNIVKTYVHPAGVALFGEYNIRNDFSAKIKLNALFSIFNIRHTDATLVNDDDIYDLIHIINDVACTQLGIDLDQVIQYDSKIYDMLKYVNDISSGVLGIPLDVTNANQPSTTSLITPTYLAGGVRQVYDLPWVANTPFNAGLILIYGANYYKVTTAGTMGVFPPMHTTGTLANGTAQLECIGTWDGVADVYYHTYLKYADNDYGDSGDALDNNLLHSTYFMDYQNWGWGNVTATPALAPDGTMTAALRTTIAAASWTATYIGAVQISTAGSYTVSVYYKPGTTTNFCFGIYDYSLGWAGGALWYYNTVGSTMNGSGLPGTTGTWTNLGTGWWRATITITGMNPNYGHGMYVYVENSVSTAAGTTDTIWGPKVELGTTATAFNPYRMQNDLYLASNFFKDTTVLPLVDITSDKWRDTLLQNGFFVDTTVLEPTDLWIDKVRDTFLQNTAFVDTTALVLTDVGTEKWRDTFLVNGAFFDFTALDPLDTGIDKWRDTSLIGNTFVDITALALTDITTDKWRDTLLQNGSFVDTSALDPLDTTTDKWRDTLLQNGSFVDTTVLPLTDIFTDKVRDVFLQNGFLLDTTVLDPLDTLIDKIRTIEINQMVDLIYADPAYVIDPTGGYSVIYDSTSIQMDGPGLMLFETSTIADYDINNNVPLFRDFETVLSDISPITDSGSVILNLFVDPLTQYVTGSYVSSPNATF